MSNFITYCNQISPLTEEAGVELLSKLKTKSFSKGELINEQGQICRNLFFIDSGLVKHYYHHKNRVFVLRFFSENNFAIVIDSFLNQKPAEFITIALENTTTTYLEYKDIEELSRKYHCFETFFRKFISQVAFNTSKRLKENFDADATELYNSFLKDYSHLLQRISLGDTASYLGISQVSLSRIRAKK